MSGFLGSGDLYYNRVVAGVDQGWLRFGNATKMEIKENSELKERISRQKDSYGQVLDSVAIKQPAEISVSLDDLDKDNLALVFLGDVLDAAVVGASVTGEAQTAHIGRALKTDFRSISVVVVKDVTDVTTYVLGTDYTIDNAELGLISPIDGGAITEGDVLHIDYTYATIAGDKVQGGTNSSVKVALMLDGENFADQSKVLVNVWEAVLSPQTGVDFLSEDFTTLELNGSLNTPTGFASGYEVETGLVYT